MLKKTSIIIVLFIITLIAFFIYQQIKDPDGITPQSNQAEMAKYAFWTAISSFAAAIVGLLQKVLELIIKWRS